MKEKKIVPMSEDKQIYEPSDAVKLKAHIKNMEEYQKLYQRSTNELEKFWENVQSSSTGIRSGIKSWNGILTSQR